MIALEGTAELDIARRLEGVFYSTHDQTSPLRREDQERVERIAQTLMAILSSPFAPDGAHWVILPHVTADPEYCEIYHGIMQVAGNHLLRISSRSSSLLSTEPLVWHEEIMLSLFASTPEMREDAPLDYGKDTRRGQPVMSLAGQTDLINDAPTNSTTTFWTDKFGDSAADVSSWISYTSLLDVGRVFVAAACGGFESV